MGTRAIVPAIAFIFCSFSQPKDDLPVKERLMHIDLVYTKVFNSAWQGIKVYSTGIPIIYYQGTIMYVANPSPQFINEYHPKLIYNGRAMKLYKTNVPADQLRFHMEVSVSTGTGRGKYDHNFPFVKCSSYEEAKSVIPGLTYEAWTAMIVHECFHVVQYRHPAFLASAAKSGSIDPALGDSLQNLYKNNGWFKTQVDRENNLILRAITSKKKTRTDSLIDDFFRIREQRRAQVKQAFHLDIAQFEQNYETLEGTARYIEAASLKLSASAKFRQPKEGEIHTAAYTEPQWLYDTAVSERYFYATGYNLARLMDKFGLHYKERLFNRGDLTLEKLLKDRTRYHQCN